MRTSLFSRQSALRSSQKSRNSTIRRASSGAQQATSSNQFTKLDGTEKRASKSARGEIVTTFPEYKNEDWAAAFASQPLEFDYEIQASQIEGQVPPELKGTLFRNGPALFYRGEDKFSHMLDGDGYVTRFSFDGSGSVRFKSRYVRTPEFEAEEAAQQVLFKGTFGTLPKDPLSRLSLALKNPANTNLLFWHDRLFALWEAGCPYEIDPRTLETKGAATLGGLVQKGIAPSSTGNADLDAALGFGNAHTAHHHVVVDPETRQETLINWTWQAKTGLGGQELTIKLYEWTEAFPPEPESRSASSSSASTSAPKAPHATLKMNSVLNPHDFAVTATHYVYAQHPMVLKMLPMLLGLKGPAQCVEFCQGPLTFHLVPRDGQSPTVQVDTDPAFLIHHANAWDEGEEIVVLSSGWSPDAVKKLAVENPRDGILGSWDSMLAGDFSAVPITHLWRHRINKRTGRVTYESMHSRSLDHPRVNPLFLGRKTRYVYYNACARDSLDTSAPPQAWMRQDLETGEKETYYAGERRFTEELIFVPRPSGTAEDDGWLLGMSYDAELDRSSLVILDARDFSKGPLARIPLRNRVPHGLHGTFTEQLF